VNTLLITGGAGNLACQLTFALAQDAGRIVLFDVQDKPVAPVAPNCAYVRGDLTRPDDIGDAIQRHRPATILHMGSLLSASCEADRARAWRVNMDGGFNLFEAALAGGVRTIFFPSSLAVFGGQLPDPLPEDHPQWPTGLYGVTKTSIERLGVYYHAHHGLDFRCLRLPVVISRHAPAGAASAYGSRAFVETVQTGRFSFRVRPTTRVSTIYVKDAIRAILMLLRAPAGRLTRRVYNLHAIAPSAAEIADAIRARVNGAEFRFEPDPAVVALIESWPAVIDDQSSRRDWDWKPAYDLDKLADEFIAELSS
jgi:threonine 3-dehydrogenase